MSDRLTAVSREDKKDIERWKKAAVDQLLKTFSTKDLVDELAKRQNVREIDCPTGHRFIALRETDPATKGKQLENVCGICNVGPARILVVKD